MKIALVHDFLIQDGGAERVLCVFREIWPDAPVFTLAHDKKRAPDYFKNGKIHTSFLQKIPFGVRHYQWLLPFMPAAVERLDLSNFDVVLSSSSAFSKNVITRPETLHICYCHTPARFLWTEAINYVNELNKNFFVKSVLPFFLPRMRVWDRAGATRPEKIIANSKTVGKRIKKYFGRVSEVINPPVEARKFSIATIRPDNYYLAGGRLVPYKRFDIAIKVFSRLGLPLKIFGIGPELKNLKETAKKNIEFLGKISDVEKTELYKKCIAFIHPQEEDFGITALEAMASGRPVIAFGKGGAVETIIPGETGEFFEEQTWECLAHSILKFNPEKYSPTKIRAHALQYDSEIFKTKIKNFVENNWHAHNSL
jgi:glycosyltransferase involved in cell wall biosynthesis